MNDDATATGPATAAGGAVTAAEESAARTMHATVLVRPKEGILDPQGQAVRDSLRKLGFSVGQVHVGRLIEVELNASSPEIANSQLEAMCRQLLTNPLIEVHEIRLAEPAPAPQPTAAHGASSLDATG